MATDKTGTWSLGESILWYSPNTTLDVTWSLGESYLEDEYGAAAPSYIYQPRGLLMGVYGPRVIEVS